MSTGAGEDLGKAFASFLQIVFTPIFPAVLITLVGVSFLLTFVFHLPEFAFIAILSELATQYSFAHLWALVVLAVFVIASVPLAWVGFREAETRASRVVGYWVVVGLGIAGTVWLARAWTYDGSLLQGFVFALILFGLWAHICETAVITAKLVVLSRPQPGREVVEAQKAHGDAAVASETEAVSLLNPKN